MKKLGQFGKFDLEAFLAGKVLRATECSELKDHNTGEHLGTKVVVAIVRDDTKYKQNEGENVTNLFEKFNIKVLKDVNVPVNSTVMPVHATATVYGEYRNMLSVTAEDIRIIPVQQNKA